MMKNMMWMALMAIVASSFLACGSEEDAGASEQTPEISIMNNPADVVPAGTVMHYICPNNCAGSGGPAQADCPVCGTPYMHNDAFHAQAGAPPVGQDMTVPPPAPGSPEPPQNSKGVWHYTCPSGCASGAGAAGPCASCGATLAHNPAYHQ